MQLVLRPTTAIILLVAITALAVFTVAQKGWSSVASSSSIGPNSKLIATNVNSKTIPFHGTSVSVPGRIEAENYDEGGNGIAYSHPGTDNRESLYRADGVHIQRCGDAKDQGYAVKFTMDSWLSYTVNVTESGMHGMTFRVASKEAKETLYVELDGRRLPPDIAIPITDGLQEWQDKGWTQVYLEKGIHNLRIVGAGKGFYLNYVDFWRVP